MSKKVTIAFDTKNGECAVDFDGFAGDDCDDARKELVRRLKILGVEVDVKKIQRKAPQIPQANPPIRNRSR